jgi:putative membrane protein
VILFFRHGPVLWFIPGLFALAFWAVIVWAVVALIRREHHDHGHWHDQGPRTEHDASSGALRILEERYARGEITREEFVERRSVLLGEAVATGPPDAPPPPQA